MILVGFLGAITLILFLDLIITGIRNTPCMFENWFGPKQ